MAIKDIFKVSRKTFFNPSAWIGYEALKADFRNFWGLVKTVFSSEPMAKSETGESFEQAMQRLQVNESDLKKNAFVYLLLALFFVLVGAGLWVYAITMLAHGHFAGFLVAISFGLLFLGQAFRYHFWRFQIIHRKLGCTFDEWLNGRLSGEVRK